jgi:hypothetical protein
LCHARCYGKEYVGDFQAGNVYELSLSKYTDNAQPIIRTMVSPVMHANRGRMFCHGLELDMQSGIGLPTGYGSDPQAMMQWSDDGCKTWSNERWSSIGKIGEYLTRVKWQRLGASRQRVFKVVITDPVPVVIISAFVEVENGDN